MQGLVNKMTPQIIENSAAGEFLFFFPTRFDLVPETIEMRLIFY